MRAFGTLRAPANSAVATFRLTSCALSGAGVPRCHARRTLWRPELYGDVLLNFDGPIIQESGLVTPQPKRAHCSGKQRERAAHAFYFHHLTELSDGSPDLYGFRRSTSIPGPWITRPYEGNKLSGLQSGGFPSRCASPIRRDKHRKLGGNRERRGGSDRSFRKNQPERFAAVAWASEKDRGRR